MGLVSNILRKPGAESMFVGLFPSSASTATATQNRGEKKKVILPTVPIINYN